MRYELANNTAAQSIGTTYTAKILNVIEDPSGIIQNSSSFTGISGTNTQIVLEPGRYRFKGTGSILNGGGIATMKTRLFNVTQGSTVAVGYAAYTAGSSADDSSAYSTTNCVFTLNSTTTLEFQQRQTVIRSSGVTANFSENEVFSIVEIEKLS
jgi:hypothetical protein